MPDRVGHTNVEALAVQLYAPLRSFERIEDHLVFVDGGGMRWTRHAQIRIQGTSGDRHLISIGSFRRLRLGDIVVSDSSGRRLSLATRAQHGDALASADPTVRKLLNHALFEKLEIDTEHPDFDTASADIVIYAEPDDFVTIVGSLAENLTHETRAQAANGTPHRSGGPETKNPGPSQTRGSHNVKMAEEEG